MSILDHGHWEGPVFVFHPVLELGPGKVLERLDTSGMDLPPEVPIEAVIEGLLDPGRKVQVLRDEL